MAEDATRVAFDVANGGSSSWSSQLQEIAEEASRALGRPVNITDRHRVLAYTQHQDEDIDRPLFMSIMKRPVPDDILEWNKRHRTWLAERPLRIPPLPELDAVARVSAPIRCEGHLLGWLSCTDPNETLTDDDLARMQGFADEAAIVLYRGMLLQDLERSRERELLRDILFADEAAQRDAAWELSETRLFTPGGRVVVLVIPVAEAGDDGSPERLRVAVDGALTGIRRKLAPRHGLHLLRPSHALILASLADPEIGANGLRGFAERLREEVVGSLPGDTRPARQIVAAGGAARQLADAAKSYRQALRAADLAASVASFGDVVCWDELGIYKILAELPVEAFGSQALHPGLTALLEDSRAHELLATLERYLDLAGDVQQTAASLYLHRTSLYHRLRRIESVANVDLRNGEDRLALHLGLKVARLQGMTWPTHEVATH